MSKGGQTLYRFWDVSDRLLYVGISVRLWQRWKEHRAEKPWWLEVVKVTIENFDTREEVRAAEAEAIRSEGPLYNIQGVLHVAPAEDEPAAWDGVHVPEIMCMGDYLYCSCQEPDWDTQPGPREWNGPEDAYGPADRWLEAQPLYRPEEYAEHVIRSTLGEHFVVGGVA